LAAKHVDFECPDCGIPLYCSEEHWMADYENHLQVCDTLRQINEDDHDLYSGRAFPEFDYADQQIDEAMVNMTNWDTFLYTRTFAAINSDRGMRQATRILTYPVTVASILHELSPYSIRAGGRLTTEGLKSFSGKFVHTYCLTEANALGQRFDIIFILPSLEEVILSRIFDHLHLP
jgi:splicing suppressor protein 51